VDHCELDDGNREECDHAAECDDGKQTTKCFGSTQQMGSLGHFMRVIIEHIQLCHDRFDSPIAAEDEVNRTCDQEQNQSG